MNSTESTGQKKLLKFYIKIDNYFLFTSPTKVIFVLTWTFEIRCTHKSPFDIKLSGSFEELSAFSKELSGFSEELSVFYN